MLTRRLNERRYGPSSSVPHIQDQTQWDRRAIERASGGGMHLPYGYEPLMPVGNGCYIPAAQDPTDPATWRVPVVFT